MNQITNHHNNWLINKLNRKIKLIISHFFLTINSTPTVQLVKKKTITPNLKEKRKRNSELGVYSLNSQKESLNIYSWSPNYYL